MSFRSVLAKYIKEPEKYPELVIYHDSNVVILKDLFPKSILHFLVMPRSPQKTKQSPLVVFKDVRFRAQMEKYIEMAKEKMVEQLNSSYECKDIDFDDFIAVGCHAVPSLSNLHIHVITRDFHSTRLKNKKHYNSFNTEFFVPFDELPLPNKTKFEEPRYDPVKMELLIKKLDLQCSFCGENFGNKFQQLKEHLSTEFSRRITKKKEEHNLI